MSVPIYTRPDDTGAVWCYGCEKLRGCDKLTDRHSVCQLERDAYEAGLVEGERRAREAAKADGDSA